MYNKIFFYFILQIVLKITFYRVKLITVNTCLAKRHSNYYTIVGNTQGCSEKLNISRNRSRQ